MVTEPHVTLGFKAVAAILAAYLERDRLRGDLAAARATIEALQAEHQAAKEPDAAT